MLVGACERTEQHLRTGDSASCCWNDDIFWHLDKCFHMSLHSLRLSTLPYWESLNSYVNKLKGECLILVSSKVFLHGNVTTAL